MTPPPPPIKEPVVVIEIVSALSILPLFAALGLGSF
jgi:hypothetical protein